MEIRPLSLDDYDAARRLWDAVDHIGPLPRFEVEQKLRRDPELFLAAVDEGTLVGTVMGSYDGRRGWIARLAVAPERRGEGIARALVAEVEERMRDLGVHRVNLLVLPENEDGAAFWERAGFPLSDLVELRSKVLSERPGDDETGSC